MSEKRKSNESEQVSISDDYLGIRGRYQIIPWISSQQNTENEKFCYIFSKLIARKKKQGGRNLEIGTNICTIDTVCKTDN